MTPMPTMSFSAYVNVAIEDLVARLQRDDADQMLQDALEASMAPSDPAPKLAVRGR
jgi:hypothetical protein